MATFPGAEIVGVRTLPQPEAAVPADDAGGDDDDTD
jgi:hypothetical protein